jgi:hypothetical protein
MNAGLPGIGIGGIFYLVCILFMLGIEIYHLMLGKDRAWHRKLAFRQFGFLCGIIGAFWVMAILIGKVIFRLSQVFHFSDKHLFSGQVEHVLQLYRMHTLFLSLFTLTCVLGSLLLMNWILDCKDEKC